MELFDALRARTSCRSFSSRVPGNKVQVDLLNYLNNVPVLLPEADISIELLSYEDLQEYFPGDAESMIRAPLYLAFRGNMGLYQFMNVGYYAEHAAVWLTGRGLGSVWQTGFKLRTLQEDEFIDEISQNESFDDDELESGVKSLLPAVFALGYPNNPSSKTTHKKKLSRISLTKVSEMNNNVLSLLEASRLAPSEYNFQPWRYAVDGNLIHIFLKESNLFRSQQRQNTRQISMGSSLGNMEIMAALRGIRLDYGFMDDVPEYGQSRGNLYYLGTITVEKVYTQMMFGIDY